MTDHPGGHPSYVTYAELSSLSGAGRRSFVRISKGERGIWQRRFWEHVIRDEADYEHHVNYVHWNPVKHGLAKTVADWPYSTFHRYVREGILPTDWIGEVGDENFGFGERNNQ
ncbi:hypothetical protein METHB2_120024 [Candidatus Methylobacter favarea]|uniref:Transposase n=1 Tax=Candidatus Methylobacter favarea TaxID=2707345 RepID=A0A8S0X707_9GAMM|nr:hypothetical protein METHB2_120024 [Candidatus Methylobacter favarea]